MQSHSCSAAWRSLSAPRWAPLLVVLALVPPARAEVSLDDDVAKAIGRGVAFLRSQQDRTGNWTYSLNHDHELGITALAGLALVENGVLKTDPAVAKASKVVRALAAESNQTYDLSLAILFLARLHDGTRGPDDALIQRLGARLQGGATNGMWGYFVPVERAPRRPRGFDRIGPPDNSNTQFALLGIWAASRHGLDANETLAAIDDHFRRSRSRDGGWGYQEEPIRTNAMTCAGLMGLAIASARPSLAERQTARARGAALAADPTFTAALHNVANDARQIDASTDIYYIWSLERVCVALGLKRIEGFDWYAAGAQELLRRQNNDGGWPHHQWGRLPNTCLALLFLRKANLAFELDRVLKLPTAAKAEPAAGPTENEGPTTEPPAPQTDDGGDAHVIVTGAREKFPEIVVEFEVKRPDGSFLLDARKADFHVTESGQEMPILGFEAPLSTESRPITVVLVVDRSLSMREEDRIGGLKSAVGTFLKGLPEGSRVAAIAFGSEVRVIQPFTSTFQEVEDRVNELTPGGATRYYDAVSEAIEMIAREPGRRAVLALTDGEDTFSQNADLEKVVLAARRIGVPVHTLGLGSEDEIESESLKQLAASTRGQYYPARRVDQLRTIYEEIANRLKSSYVLTYRTDQKLPDGTLRPVRIYYRAAKEAGVTAIFIPGMVVPSGGWPALFLVLLVLLALLSKLPYWLDRLLDRRAGSVPPPAESTNLRT
jgi:VWFA-related protein